MKERKLERLADSGDELYMLQALLLIRKYVCFFLIYAFKLLPFVIQYTPCYPG